MAVTAFAEKLKKSQIKRIYGESKNPIEEASRYSAILPDTPDLILLSVGEDGHIASLFPDSSALKSAEKMVYVSTSPKPPADRITITPRVIKNAKNVILMAAGKIKGQVLAKALNFPQDISKLPVRLTIGRTWVLDEEAAISFRLEAIENKYKTNIIYA